MMRSKDQLAVIACLEKQGAISARRIEKLMEWDNKHTHNILGRLVRIGIIRKTGKQGRPEYQLTACWKSKPTRERSELFAVEINIVCEECRQNWQGYQVHKIFGSGVRA